MTLDQFTATAAQTRLKARSLDAARLVLVDGMTKAQAGRAVGISRAAAGVAVEVVERAHKATMGCPEGWAVLSVCLPLDSDAWRAVSEIERAELARCKLTPPHANTANQAAARRPT